MPWTKKGCHFADTGCPPKPCRLFAIDSGRILHDFASWSTREVPHRQALRSTQGRRRWCGHGPSWRAGNAWAQRTTSVRPDAWVSPSSRLSPPPKSSRCVEGRAGGGPCDRRRRERCQATWSTFPVSGTPVIPVKTSASASGPVKRPRCSLRRVYIPRI